MSKDFEKEYNQMLDSEIPDLWSRIEPQLHDKAVINDVAKESAKQVKVTRKHSKFVPFPMIGGLVAACLVAFLVIPFSINIKNKSNSVPASFDAVASENMASASEDTASSTDYDSINYSEKAETSDIAAAEAPAESANNTPALDSSYSDASEENAYDEVTRVYISDFAYLQMDHNVDIYALGDDFYYCDTTYTNDDSHIPNELFEVEVDDITYFCMYYSFEATEYAPSNISETGCIIGLSSKYFSTDEAESILLNAQFY